MGSNPTVALALVAFLTAIRFIGNCIKEAIMSKKRQKSKSNASANKRNKGRLASIIAHFFETVWAMGVSAAATMVISTSTH